MVSIDTNILFLAFAEGRPAHSKAIAFLDALSERGDVVLSEFILLELYILLRNPAVAPKPLNAGEATAVCQAFRNHPRWQIAGFPGNSAEFHNRFWLELGREPFPRRRAFDLRAARALQEFGVTDFATENIKDFQGLGFKRVWNPIA